LTDESVPPWALDTWLSNIAPVPDRNGVCSLATESGHDDPQPVLDCLVDLNSTGDENFGFAIDSFPSWPPIETAAHQTPFNIPESVGESYHLFQRSPFGAVPPTSISPLTSPTFDPNPTHSLISAPVAPRACLSPDQHLSGVRELRQVAPSPSQRRKCPHCQ